MKSINYKINHEGRVKQTFIILVMLFLIGLFSVDAFAQNIGLDNVNYYIGDVVKISLYNTTESDVLEIYDSKNAYKFLGAIDESLDFIAKLEGVHQVTIYDSSSNIKDQVNFYVGQDYHVDISIDELLNEDFNQEGDSFVEVETISTIKNPFVASPAVVVSEDSSLINIPKRTFEYGEVVNIDIRTKAKELRILHNDNVFKYLGVLQERIQFTPKEEGQYIIQLILEDKSHEEEIFFVGDVSKNSEILQSMVQNSLVEIVRESVQGASTDTEYQVRLIISDESNTADNLKIIERLPNGFTIVDADHEFVQIGNSVEFVIDSSSFNILTYRLKTGSSEKFHTFNTEIVDLEDNSTIDTLPSVFEVNSSKGFFDFKISNRRIAKQNEEVYDLIFTNYGKSIIDYPIYFQLGIANSGVNIEVLNNTCKVDSKFLSCEFSNFEHMEEIRIPAKIKVTKTGLDISSYEFKYDPPMSDFFSSVKNTFLKIWNTIYYVFTGSVTGQVVADTSDIGTITQEEIVVIEQINEPINVIDGDDISSIMPTSNKVTPATPTIDYSNLDLNFNVNNVVGGLTNIAVELGYVPKDAPSFKILYSADENFVDSRLICEDSNCKWNTSNVDCRTCYVKGIVKVANTELEISRSVIVDNIPPKITSIKPSDLLTSNIGMIECSASDDNNLEYVQQMYYDDRWHNICYKNTCQYDLTNVGSQQIKIRCQVSDGANTVTEEIDNRYKKPKSEQQILNEKIWVKNYGQVSLYLFGRTQQELFIKNSNNQTTNVTTKLLYEDDFSMDLSLDFEDEPVKNIVFNKVSKLKTPTVKYELVDSVKIRDKQPKAHNVFAIDPTVLDFESAEVTIEATGTELWKCKDYDFENQNCFGEFVKIADLIPGNLYTFTLTPEDPVFSQTGYLTNPSFDTDTTSWTTLTEGAGGGLAYNWIASSGGRSGVAEIVNTASDKQRIGNYYQTWTLTIPTGTILNAINFSALWRINNYDAGGNVALWIQDATQSTTICSNSASYSSTTSWAPMEISTYNPGCSIGSFSTGTTYTFRLRCDTSTSKTVKLEACHWDEASIIVYYNDTQNPSINSIADAPDPVSIGGTINFTADVTDNIQVGTVLVEINGANYSMDLATSPVEYYFDAFNTNIAPGTYNYVVHANDTSGNLVSSGTGTFEISDEEAPKIQLLNPQNNTFTNSDPVSFFYNVSDASPISFCDLIVDNVVVDTDVTVTRDIQQEFPYTLSYGSHSWYVNCTDASSNANPNSSEIRNVTFDNIVPNIGLINPINNEWLTTSSVIFEYVPNDDYLQNCSLWTNQTGTWSLRQNSSNPVNGASNFWSAETLSDGSYLWNVRCYDLGQNIGWNSTNFTVNVDTTPPNFSGVIENPSSGTIWQAPQNYQFNVSWSDLLNNIGSVWIENNFTGTMQNDSPTGSALAEYYFDISNLPAGSYYYRWYANDSLGNVNSTTGFIFNINRASSFVNLTLNGTDDDFYIGLNDFVNLTAILQTPNSGFIELYIDGVLINSGSSPLENISQFLLEQAYNISAVYPQTQNYSRSIDTHFVIVQDTTPPTVGLLTPVDGSFEQGTVFFTYIPNDNIAISNCTLILDSVENETKTATEAIVNNFTVSGLTDGSHTFDVNCSDPTGLTAINGSPNTFTVDTINPSTFDLVSPNGLITNSQSVLLDWNPTTEVNFRNYTIQIDNDQGFGSINYIYLNNTISGTQRQTASLTDQRVWFWRVIAYDLADNTRQSNQVYNFTIDTLSPTIQDVSPLNDSWSNNFTNSFFFNVSDFTPILNCSIYINGVLNETRFDIVRRAKSNFTITFNQDNDYNYSISCYDSAENRVTTVNRTLHVHTTPPDPFDLLSPLNNTLSSNRNPRLNWSNTIDPLFSNYTIQISNESDFSNIVYTYYTYFDTDSNYTVTSNWADGTWYWRVISYDFAGNQRTSNQEFIYRVDAKNPNQFNLIEPLNGTDSTNQTPLLNWTNSSDANFDNYTIYVSDDINFAYRNFTYSVFSQATSFYQVVSAWPVNAYYYWYVVAFDAANNTRRSTSTFLYHIDTDTPLVSLESPVPDFTWDTSGTVTFEYNVTDLGTIKNCTLRLNGTDYQTDDTIVKSTTQSFLQALPNGGYNWSVYCYDAANNVGYSLNRSIFVNFTVPTSRLYETSSSGSYTPTALINLSYDYDFVEDSVGQNVPTLTTVNYVNATYTVGGSGFVLPGSTWVNFSGEWVAGQAGTGYVSWHFYMNNASGEYRICGFGDNATGGAVIPTRNSREVVVGSCTSGLNDAVLSPGDSLTLRVVFYNNHPQARTYTHYWDNADDSWVEFQGYRLGLLNISTLNLTDPNPGELEYFNHQCNVTCDNGLCVNTQVYVQRNTSNQTWSDVGSTGNIILNVTQDNPVVLGTINNSVIVNFSLQGITYSDDNKLRCYAVSDDHSNYSDIRNVTVTDKILPNVTLISPENGSAFDPQTIPFIYQPYDERLTNCTLWGNFTGTWAATDQSTTSPLNNQNNTFNYFVNYGKYAWNVLCLDINNNSAFAGNNYTIVIAGDLSINSSGIIFSDPAPVEGQDVLIFANVTNNANKNESNVVARFYDGDPDFGGVQIGTDQLFNITALNSTLVNVTFTVPVGSSEIFVRVDPPIGSGAIIESDETNNEANNTLNVESYHTYYGTINATLKLTDSVNNTFDLWYSMVAEGNIYITDSETSSGISWAFLVAIGRNTTDLANANTLNDFAEIDTNLGIQNNFDNINDTYTNSGLPKALDTFIVYDDVINNVPIINSTNSTNFITGILWDSDDSINPYYDAVDDEDLIFISKMNDGQLGAFGTYDYEISIPANLRAYKGASGNVALYYELT